MKRLVVARELTAVARLLAADPFAMERRHHIPRDVEAREEEHPEVNLVVYLYEQNDKLYALAFAGKQNKPLWHYRFRNDNERRRKIETTIADLKSLEDRKQQRRQERQEFRHDLKEGDILYSSWGYDQTNVDFYQVVEVGEKTVRIREIEKRMVRGERGADYVVADKDRFTGPSLTKRVSQGNCVRINNYAIACKWDGKPKYQTPFGFGH